MWTRTECNTLLATGVWEAGTHLELIEGELIDKMGKNQPHSFSVSRIVRWLNQVFEWVYPESSINVSPQDNPTSEPQPDAVVLKPPFRGFRPEQPKPNELALVVEVSDTTLQFDLGVKARLYARAGIEDYWVIDLKGRCLIVHRKPVDGEYQSVEAYGEAESVTPLSAPGHSLLVRDVLT
jgi:Uma2 family endonuclease